MIFLGGDDGRGYTLEICTKYPRRQGDDDACRPGRCRRLLEDDDVWVSGNRSDGFCSFKLRGGRSDSSGEWVDGCFGGGVNDDAGFELITCWNLADDTTAEI